MLECGVEIRTGFAGVRTHTANLDRSLFTGACPDSETGLLFRPTVDGVLMALLNFPACPVWVLCFVGCGVRAFDNRLVAVLCDFCLF
jgi:hypothetical protein